MFKAHTARDEWMARGFGESFNNETRKSIGTSLKDGILYVPTGQHRDSVKTNRSNPTSSGTVTRSYLSTSSHFEADQSD